MQVLELADVAGQARRRRGAPVISSVAVEAVRRIDALFDIERAVLGKPAAERRAVRQELSRPLVTDLGRLFIVDSDDDDARSVAAFTRDDINYPRETLGDPSSCYDRPNPRP